MDDYFSWKRMHLLQLDSEWLNSDLTLVFLQLVIQNLKLDWQSWKHMEDKDTINTI